MSSLSRLWCHFQKPSSLEVGCFRSYSRLSSNPFPFPIHPNAQPHDIFHLPRSATQKEIKQRCKPLFLILLDEAFLTCLPIDYDLVRVYHPDSIIARRYPPEVTQERIQAINKAYDILRGRAISLEGPISATPGPRMDSAWFKPRSSRRPYFDDVVGDDRWTERTIVLIAVFVSTRARAGFRS